MKDWRKTGSLGLPLLLAMAGLIPSPARAQNPVVPIVVDTAVPIIIDAVKPKPKPTGLARFQGFVQNANVAQITVRAKGNELDLQTFPLSAEAAAKMQVIVDKGGYQFGDKVTILYNPTTHQAVKIKGKASKPV